MPLSFKHKFVAALLAFIAGGLGLHRRYLGDGRWWLYAAWLVTGMAAFALFGSKAHFWILVPALLPVWAGFAESMGIAVTDDARWDARHNAHSARRSDNGWNCVFLAIVVLLVGTTMCLTTIILAAQYHYEDAMAVAAVQPAPTGTLPSTPSTK